MLLMWITYGLLCKSQPHSFEHYANRIPLHHVDGSDVHYGDKIVCINNKFYFPLALNDPKLN